MRGHPCPLARVRSVRAVPVLLGLVLAASLGVLAPSADASTTATAACAVNIRTGPSTSYAIRTSIALGTSVTVAATVSGGSYAASCGGASVSGDTWFRLSAINGRSLSSLYGVSYLYAASRLFRVVTPPTPSPTPTPSPPPSPTPSPSTTTTSACAVNIRTGPSTTYAIRTSIAAGTAVTAAATVTGGYYATPCGSSSVSGNSWFRLSAIGGRSVASLYGVSYLYAASKLFKVVAAPPPGVLPAGVTPVPATVTFYGRGYGHGVGLSQYGAKGRAADGQAAGQILAHYFAGTAIGTTDPAANTRVLVLAGYATSPSAPLLIHGRGGNWTVDGIAATFPADAALRAWATLTTMATGTAATWTASVTATDGSVLYAGPLTGAPYVRPAAPTTLLQLDTKPSSFDTYRGSLRLLPSAIAATVSVVNGVPLDQYLRGVVPAEMPSTWPTEALRAQAIASRTYAAYRLRASGSYDVTDDTGSQVYQGVERETTATDAAITATSGKVVTSGGQLANVFFHSTGGGATENNEYAFVSATGAIVSSPLSYLRGSPDRRADGSSYDAGAPYATWRSSTYTIAALSSILAGDSRTAVGTLTGLDLRARGVSGRLYRIVLYGTTGTRTVSGDVFRAVFNAHRPSADLSLMSTLFALAPLP